MSDDGRAWHALGAALLVVTLAIGIAGWIGIVPPRLVAVLSPMLIGLGLAGVALITEGGSFAEAWREERAQQKRARHPHQHRRARKLHP